MVTRIRQLLEDKQLTPTQFADLIGVGRPVVSHILSERNKPSLEVVQHIITAFPEIALPWLLSGTGPMLAGTAPAAPPAPALAEEPASRGTLTAEPAAPTPSAEAVPDRPAPAPRVAPVISPAAGPATAAPVAPRPFRAARLAPPVGGPAGGEAAVAPPVAAPVLLTEAVAPAPAQPSPPPLPLLAEAGKGIRRIVIFYQDGSFTDYQPEA